MEHTMLRRWGNDLNLSMVMTDDRGKRYIPFARISFLEILDSDDDRPRESSQVRRHPYYNPPSMRLWEDLLPHHEVVIPRPLVLQGRLSVRRRRNDNSITFRPHSRDSRDTHRLSRDYYPKPEIKRQRYVQYSKPNRPPPLMRPRPNSKYDSYQFYPPKLESNNLLGVKRRLIRRQLADANADFDVYNAPIARERPGFYPIYLPERRESVKIVDRRTSPVLEIYTGYQELPPPLPERRYLTADPNTNSAFTAFNPLEGQITSRNRPPIINKWQEALISKGLLRRHRFVEVPEAPEEPKAEEVEDSPDY